MEDEIEKIIEDFWYKHYCTEHCTLCGNSGVIDTTGRAITAAGLHVGKKNLCICPNAFALRNHMSEDHIKKILE